MNEKDSNGVLIGTEESYVRLSRLGPACELGTPVSIEARAGPFDGAVNGDELIAVGTFCEQLSDLHRDLEGKATLTEFEKMELIVVGNGRGAISVRVEIYAGRTPLSLLSFEFDLDQTYLPKIIKELREEFPEG